jgi:hypothetical protein
MTISYAITVCNEVDELKRLVIHLRKFMRAQDEIVILHDTTKSTPEIEDLLNIYNGFDSIVVVSGEFKGHFANWKNRLNGECKGDWIFQIDADEYPHEVLISNLYTALEGNSEVDMMGVPRVNTVEGITDAHIRRWGWRVNEEGWVNFPDIQTRIYKNHPNIKWVGRVHERIQGHKYYAQFAHDEIWSLYHPKTIEKQEKQNNYYNTL